MNDIASAVIVAGITASSTMILNIIKGNREKNELKMEHANIKEKIGTEHADIKASLKEKMGTEHADIKAGLQEVQKFVYEETVLREKSSNSEIDFKKISDEIISMGASITTLQNVIQEKDRENRDLYRNIVNLSNSLDEKEKHCQELAQKLERALRHNRELEAMMNQTEEWEENHELER